MIHRRLFPFIAVLVLLTSMVIPSFAEELSLPGSGNPEFILGKLAEAFNASQTRHHVTIPESEGTAGALRAIEEGSATLARVGRPLKESEQAGGIRYIPLGLDPVVFVAGAGVTVKGITSAQAVAIYKGDISDWSELGGEAAPIRAIGREVSDSSRKAMGAYIPELLDITYGPGIKVVHLDPQLIELLDRYPSSFGILNRSATLACQTPVVHLELDGAAPTIANLEGNRYPVWREMGLIHGPKGLSAAGKAFVEFIQSREGIAVLEQYGVSPMPPR